MDPLEFYDHLLILPRNGYTGIINDHVIEVLADALKGRIICLSKLSVPVGTEHVLAVGMKLIVPESDSYLTKGPLSDSDSGRSFRTFWGEKAELRRVDGDLYECISWSPKENVIKQIIDYVLMSRFQISRGSLTTAAWHQITPDQLNALLSTHCVPRYANFVVASSLRLVHAMDRLRGLLRGLNDKLPLNVTGILPISSALRDAATFPPILTNPSRSQTRHSQQGELKDIRGDILRLSVSYPIYPLYVVITLEQSGKWPDELEAFQNMKCLLLIRIHELLSPMGVPSHVTRAKMLDVFLDGLVFRLSIALVHELRLLQSVNRDASNGCDVSQCANLMVGDPSTKPTYNFRSTQTVNSLDWIRLNRNLPTISGLLTAVSRSSTPVFSSACRLAKRWLSAHGYPVILCPFEADFDGSRCLNYDTIRSLDTEHDRSNLCMDKAHTWNVMYSTGRMTEIAVELLIVHCSGFFSSAALHDDRVASCIAMTSGTIPSMGATWSPVAAFLRFLNLLATYDWGKRPLLVDLNNGFSDAEKRRLSLNSFQENRDLLPAMVICTPVDPLGTEWTTVGPTRSGLRELKRIATQSRTLLRAMLVAGAQLKDLKAVFRPTHKNLDLLITLRPEILHVRSSEALDFVRPRVQPNITSSFTHSNSTEIPSPGARFWPPGYCYDPVSHFAHLLKKHLGRFCDVRWDRHGGNWVGLKWHPSPLADEKGRIPFEQTYLDGLKCHALFSKSSEQIFATCQFDSLNSLLPHWASHFVQTVKSPHFTLPRTRVAADNPKRKLT